MLDLVNRRISSGGDMATSRDFLQVATIISDGQRKMFALAGGSVSSTALNTVEEWVEESSSWKAANNLAEKRQYFREGWPNQNG